SYFNILIFYGDEYEVLGFRDLISVKAETETDIRVDLRNPEYDITQAIKKVIKGYSGKNSLFENIDDPVTLTAYISQEESLPDSVQVLRDHAEKVFEELVVSSKGKFSYQFVDPDDEDGKIATELEAEFGFQPMTTSYFNDDRFWFYLVLESHGKVVMIELPQNLETTSLEKNIKAAVKKFSVGFMKTIGFVAPTPTERNNIGGTGTATLKNKLSESYLIDETILTEAVAENVDLLLVLSPRSLDYQALFALDQFLMRGGTIIVATSPYDITTGEALAVNEIQSGLEDWLRHNGLNVEKSMVLDESNSAFPVPVDRNIGGFVVRETKLVDYPYFVDIRGENLLESSVISGLDHVTLTWPSPIIVDEGDNEERNVIRILESSERSWNSSSVEIQPNYEKYSEIGFPVSSERSKSLLGVAVEGRFRSYFEGKPHPLSEKLEEDVETSGDKQDSEVVRNLLTKSPVSSRIVLFSSNTFVSDVMLELASSAMGTRYEKPADLLHNAVDWSLEETGLLSLRGRGQFVRTLPSLSKNAKLLLEYLNYFFAFFLLFLIWYFHKVITNNRRSYYERTLEISESAGEVQ
ncbi:MAG: GldG family protein, partial [Pseudomonadota bacterium]|nr:GldG family protein [Pseudomonadota bacterium]